MLNKTVSFLQFWPMPAGVVTGNRQETKVPTSTIEGGRMRLVNSSTLDGSVGRIYNDAAEAGDAGDSMDEDDGPEQTFRDNIDASEDVTNVKYMNEERTHGNMVFCHAAVATGRLPKLLFWFCRRVLQK